MPYNQHKKVYKNIEVEYEEYMEQFLYEFLKDYPSREEYMAEFIIPMLKTCCPKGAKVIPVFADRNVGKNTSKERKKRMNLICAPFKKDEYIVPDFLYVPDDYSHATPKKPLVMVETKSPEIIDFENENYHKAYMDILKTLEKSEKMQDQVKAEIKACGILIFTDGITWAFLELKRGKIVESTAYRTIRLLNVHKKVFCNPKSNRLWPDYRIVGSRFVGDDDLPEDYDTDTVGMDGFYTLMDQLFDLVSNKVSGAK